MRFSTHLTSRNVITIPSRVRRIKNLEPKQLAILKIRNKSFLVSLRDRNQSMCCTIPTSIIRSLNIKKWKEIWVSIDRYVGEVKSRKHLAKLNSKFLSSKIVKINEEEHDFKKIRIQLEDNGFSLDRILFKISEFRGNKYKYASLPKKIKEGNYIIFRFNGVLFIRRAYGKSRLSVPTKFYSNKKKNCIEVLGVLNEKEFFKKPKSATLVIKGREFLDIAYFLQPEIEVNGELTKLIVQYFNKSKILIYYDLKGTKGKVKKPLVMERYIPTNVFIQFLGFYFGDGFKKGSRIMGGVNSEESVILWLNKFLKTYFYERLEYEIVHGRYNLDRYEENKVKEYWSRICEFKIGRISYNKSNQNPKKFGSLRIYIQNTVANRIFNHLLEVFHNMIKRNSDFAKFYLKGIAMSDGGVCFKRNKLSCILIGHQKNNKVLRRHYTDVLNSYGIKNHLVRSIGAVDIYNTINYIRFITDDIFRDHKSRRERLIEGFLNLDNVIRIKERLGLFKKPITAEEFRKLICINDDPYQQLSYLKRNKLIEEIETYPRLYKISQTGEKLLGIVNNF